MQCRYTSTDKLSLERFDGRLNGISTFFIFLHNLIILSSSVETMILLIFLHFFATSIVYETRGLEFNIYYFFL